MGWLMVGPEASAEGSEAGTQHRGKKAGHLPCRALAASPGRPGEGVIVGNTAVSKGVLSSSHQPLPPPGCTGRLILCCSITLCLKTTMVSNSLTASVGWEFGCGLAGWLWHGVSHAGSSEGWTGAAGPTLEAAPSRGCWLGLSASPCGTSHRSVATGGQAHREQFGATSLRGGISQSWGHLHTTGQHHIIHSPESLLRMRPLNGGCPG